MTGGIAVAERIARTHDHLVAAVRCADGEVVIGCCAHGRQDGPEAEQERRESVNGAWVEIHTVSSGECPIGTCALIALSVAGGCALFGVSSIDFKGEERPVKSVYITRSWASFDGSRGKRASCFGESGAKIPADKQAIVLKSIAKVAGSQQNCLPFFLRCAILCAVFRAVSSVG